MMNVKPYISLARPANVLIAFISILVGGFVSGPVDQTCMLVIAAVSGALIAAGGNAVNDYYDIEIDRINKPARPLPSKTVQPERALIYALSLLCAGAGLGAVISAEALVIAVCAAAAVFVYSRSLKQMALWGNVCVSAVSGMAFVYGGIAAGNTGRSLIAGLFAFLFHLAREIIKDCEDMEGDKALGAATLPIVLGLRPAVSIAQAVLAVLIAVTLVMYKPGMFSSAYLYVVVPGVDAVLLGIILVLFFRQDRVLLGRLSVIMKIDMLIGLAALYLGR